MCFLRFKAGLLVAIVLFLFRIPLGSSATCDAEFVTAFRSQYQEDISLINRERLYEKFCSQERSSGSIGVPKYLSFDADTAASACATKDKSSLLDYLNHSKYSFLPVGVATNILKTCDGGLTFGAYENSGAIVLFASHRPIEGDAATVTGITVWPEDGAVRGDFTLPRSLGGKPLETTYTRVKRIDLTFTLHTSQGEKTVTVSGDKRLPIRITADHNSEKKFYCKIERASGPTEKLGSVINYADATFVTDGSFKATTQQVDGYCAITQGIGFQMLAGSRSIVPIRDKVKAVDIQRDKVKGVDIQSVSWACERDGESIGNRLIGRKQSEMGMRASCAGNFPMQMKID